MNVTQPKDQKTAIHAAITDLQARLKELPDEWGTLSDEEMGNMISSLNGLGQNVSWQVFRLFHFHHAFMREATWKVERKVKSEHTNLTLEDLGL